MAGKNAAFNADEFRTAIREAMLMGQPNEVKDQVTFLWLEKDVFAAEGPGPEMDPYDWTATPTAVAVQPKRMVQVYSAVEYRAGAITGDAMGAFDASTVTLTILDQDWEAVVDVGTSAGGVTEEEILPDQVLIGDISYAIDPPGAVPSGLFDVTVYTMNLSALA